jgi:hypothetical protein
MYKRTQQLSLLSGHGGEALRRKYVLAGEGVMSGMRKRC